MKINRATVPHKMISLLFNDDSYFSEVLKNKKIVINKYPRNDQWVDESGLNISFALAGYSSEDIKVEFKGRVIYVSNKNKIEESNSMQKGLIVRGIAKRNFVEEMYVHPDFNISEISAEMKDGLLKIKIPLLAKEDLTEVSIK
jgi:HSP20 family molecular chaperone IbpA